MKFEPIGYEALIQKLNLDVIPNWHRSFISLDSYTHRVEKDQKFIKEIYPQKYQIKDNVVNHLEFALKYDGLNLSIFELVFKNIDKQELVDYIQAKPTGKYSRKIWFLYEFLTSNTLPIDDLKTGNYIELLDNKKYYTLPTPIKVKRYRIEDNLLGGKDFCPIVRKSEKLKDYQDKNLSKKSKELIKNYPEALLKRAMSYLYTKETKSSFEIEKIEPSTSRIERFISLLKDAQKDDFCTKENLILLQNRIVDERFRDSDYRITQNYVGESYYLDKEKVHYISPKPTDLRPLMQGLIDSHERLKGFKELAVIHASVIAYGFVYLHPFEDGNGRIHRFLLHNILAMEDFTPREVIFPLSALMLKEQNFYDNSLEEFSLRLLQYIDYELDEDGKMLVLNDTKYLYKSIDMTMQTEAVFEFISKTIDVELSNELEFILSYDRSKKVIQEIVDMPDRLIDLFIRFVMQNNGKLSSKKREKYFDFLSDDEIDKMLKCIG